MARVQIKASPQAIAALKAQLAAANQANEAKRPDIALEKADQILAKHPRLAEAHLVRATALMSFRKVDLALAALGEAAKCAPQDEVIWTRYVTDLHRAGQKGRARRVADKAPLKGLAKKRLKALAKDGPNLATTSLGDVPPDRVHEVRRAIEARRLEEARDLLEPLIADWPEVAFLHNMRGIIHMESGANGAAEQAFRRALTLSPGFSEAQANLGAALSRTGQIREAVEVLSAAFSANPLDYAAKYNLADALYQAGRLNEARILGEEMRDQSPDNNDVLTHLARVYGGMGEHQRVVDTIQKVWASRPVDMGEVQNYVTSVDALEGIDAALKVLDEIDECDDQQRIKALFLGRAGRLDEAVEISRRLIERKPNDGVRYRRYGSFRPWLPDNPLIDDMRALWAKRQSSRQDRVELGFALSKALDDIGEYSEAFVVISETNRLQKQEVAIPPSDPRKQVDLIAKQWDRAAVRSLKGTSKNCSNFGAAV